MMVSGLEKRIPGISQRLVFSNLGTPLTNEHYVSATRGNIYGTGKVPEQVGPLSFSPRTEFGGLYMCGASTLGHGVVGATQSGIAAAKTVLNCRTRDILTQNGPDLTILPSEDISHWPENLRRKIAGGVPAREEEEKEFV